MVGIQTQRSSCHQCPPVKGKMTSQTMRKGHLVETPNRLLTSDTGKVSWLPATSLQASLRLFALPLHGVTGVLCVPPVSVSGLSLPCREKMPSQAGSGGGWGEPAAGSSSKPGKGTKTPVTELLAFNFRLSAVPTVSLFAERSA